MAATRANKDPSKTKSRTIHARVTEEQLEAISAAAKAADLTVSAFFSSLLLEGAGVVPFLTDDDRVVLRVLHEDMRKVGVNLNQVARALNSGRAVYPDEVFEALHGVLQVTDAMRSELRNLTSRPGREGRGSQ